MWPLLPTHPRVLNVIKVMSCLFIAGALGLVIGKIGGVIAENSWLEHAFWIGSAALLFHILEGVVAGILAYDLKENPVKAGIYTFWTGIAGVIEILERREERNKATTVK